MTMLTARSRAHHYGLTQHADHYVYRCYDAEGRLLYIGCTHNVARRIAAHRRGSGGAKASRWLAVSMVRFEVDGPYCGRDEGREAEREAIQSEEPLFNYQERANERHAAWMTRRPIVEYLIEHGHVDLAKETACNCGSEFRDIGELDPNCVAHADESQAFTDLELAVILS